MPSTLLQTASGNGTDYSNTNVRVLSTPVTAGSTLIMGITAGSADAVASVTDNRGNAWTLVTTVNNGERAAWMYYAKNAAAGSTTVTITYGSGMFPDSVAIIREYSGMDVAAPLDKFATGSDGTSYLQNHPAGTTAALTASDQTVIVFSGASDKTPGWSAGTGYSSMVSQAGFDLYSSGAMSQKAVSVTTAQTGNSLTTSYVRGIGITATFKSATGPSFPADVTASLQYLRPGSMFF